MNRALIAALLALWSLVAVSADKLSLELALQPSQAGDWRVTYRLSEPVGALVFARGNGDYRTGSWTMSDSAFVIERFGATDRIRRRDDGAFTEVAADLSPYSGRLSKDYTPFLNFSDGGKAVFTGQFIVGEPLSPLSADFVDGASSQNTLWLSSVRIRLVPGDYSRMIVAARVVEEPVEVELDEGDYVYYGTATTLETPVLTAVTDGEAPDWLRQHLYDSMAMTFEYFERRLGSMTSGRPFLLTVFRPLEGGSISFSGGVIGPQLAIELGLGDAITDTPEEREFMARFFAHESAHLWNNSRVAMDNPADSWVHEGGAEASSWLALDALGLQNPDAARQQFERAANDCAKGLANGPLREAARRDEFRSYYDCGAVIALATHSLMRQRGEDLFTFWRRLIEAGESAENRYRASTYYQLAGEIADGFDEQLQLFADGAHDNGSDAVVGLLEYAGVAISREADEKLEISAMP